MIRHSRSTTQILPFLQRSFSSKSDEASPTTSAKSSKPSMSKKKKSSRHMKDQSNKKENFAKKYLDPASRGERAKDHSSGIPKLAGRKVKGHGLKDQYDGVKNRKIDEILEEEPLSMSDVQRGNRQEGKKMRKGRSNHHSAIDKTQQRVIQREKVPQPDFAHLFLEKTPAELDPILNLDNHEWLGEEAEVDPNIQDQGKKSDVKEYDVFGEVVNPEEEKAWKTDAFSMEYTFKHSESRREPRPIKHPSSREEPTVEFIQEHKAFIYASNLPRPVIDDRLGVWANPLHRHKVTEYVAKQFGVPATDVFPATMHSAYIGFRSPNEASDFCVASDKNRQLSYHVEASLYSNVDNNVDSTESKGKKDFVSAAESSECIIYLQNIPPGTTKDMILQHINETDRVIEQPEIMFETATNVLLRFTSSDNANALLQDSKLNSILWNMGHQNILFQSALRQVKHSHFGGNAQLFPIKKIVDRLLVVGDTPSSDFFLSHSGVLHLTNVPANVTKTEISAYFQPYCLEKRDIEGSIEIVKSICGRPTGRVYVGFDLEMEIEAALTDIIKSNRQIRLRDSGSTCRVKIVREDIKKGKKLGPRTYRTEEELWESLRCWEDYVDPKDLEYFESKGIYKEVLEEAFIAARYHNPTYGVEDQARRGERLLSKKKPGQHFREFVETYVSSLKELIPTKDNPGEAYIQQFRPGEEIDFELLKKEEQRMRKLKEKYYGST